MLNFVIHMMYFHAIIQVYRPEYNNVISVIYTCGKYEYTTLIRIVSIIKGLL